MDRRPFERVVRIASRHPAGRPAHYTALKVVHLGDFHFVQLHREFKRRHPHQFGRAQRDVMAGTLLDVFVVLDEAVNLMTQQGSIDAVFCGTSDPGAFTGEMPTDAA